MTEITESPETYGVSKLNSILKAATSRKTIAILMLLFAGCLVLQALLPQKDIALAASYARFWNKLPFLKPAAIFTGMDRIASTAWFQVIWISLALCLALCIFRRVTEIKAGKTSAWRYEVTSKIADSGLPASAITGALRQRRFAPFLEGNSIYSQKGTQGLWGSVIFHAGILLVCAGVVLSSLTRFSGFVELAPGQVQEASRGYTGQQSRSNLHQVPEMSIFVSDINMAFWPDNTLRDLSSHVRISGRSGKAEGTITRNKSLRLQGNSVNLGSRIGPAALLSYTGLKDSRTVQGYVNFPGESEFPRNTFVVPGINLETAAELLGPWQASIMGEKVSSPVKLRLTLTDKLNQSAVKEIELRQAIPLEGGELRFIALEPWAVFQVIRDSGFPLLIAGILISLIGMALSFLIAPCRLKIIPEDDGWHITGYTSGSKSLLLKELNDLENSLRSFHS